MNPGPAAVECPRSRGRSGLYLFGRDDTLVTAQQIQLRQDGWPCFSWWGFHGIPRPAFGPRFTFCDAPSPELRPSDVRHTCARIPGHTGRHAAYGTHEIVAVWP